MVLLLFKFAVCPAGFRGLNCSSKCNAPKYGLGCVEHCECDPCHHIYGCNLTITELGKNSKNVLKVVKDNNNMHYFLCLQVSYKE